MSIAPFPEPSRGGTQATAVEVQCVAEGCESTTLAASLAQARYLRDGWRCREHNR